MGFPGGSVGKESTCNTVDMGSVPGPGSSSREGNGSPLHYSCLENSMDRRVWCATVLGLQKVGHNCATKLPYHHTICMAFLC